MEREGGGQGVKAWLYQIIVFEVFNKRKQQNAFTIFTHFQAKRILN